MIRSTEKVVYNDLAQPWQIGFQEGASSTYYGIIELHDQIVFSLMVVLIGVTSCLTAIIWDVCGAKLVGEKVSANGSGLVYKYKNHGTLVEIIWTVTPALILLAIAFPSFKLLYLMDEVIDPAVTLKAIGYQWYWQYEYGDSPKGPISFDSFMVPTDELEMGSFRLLEVDTRVIIPVETRVRVIVTAADVIHSWALPSLGIKVDAIPGRLNQTSFIAEREGVYYGQCSEICGTNHLGMPIVVEAVSLDEYISWIEGR